MTVSLTLALGDETLVDHAPYASTLAAQVGAVHAMSAAAATRPGCFGRWRVTIEPQEVPV